MANFKSRKVVIVGAGAVGSGFAFALAQSGIAEEITLLDVNTDLAKGQALDLAHGAPFYRPVSIQAGSAPDAYRNAAIVVVTAGKAQAGPGQSRLDLLQINAKIVTSIVSDIQSVNPDAIVLVATNPVDVLTHVARLRTDWPRGRILGSGTVLDSARFRWLLAEHCGISPRTFTPPSSANTATANSPPGASSMSAACKWTTTARSAANAILSAAAPRFSNRSAAPPITSSATKAPPASASPWP